jgi:hypothetical protein
MAPLRSSSRGCEPAKSCKIELSATLEGPCERKLIVRTLDVPAYKMLIFLRSLESPPPAIRWGRRTRSKGKGCIERRKLMRERASDSVVRPEADKLSPKAAEFRPAPPRADLSVRSSASSTWACAGWVAFATTWYLNFY